jgi:RHS repeat-associated protein
MPLAMVTGPAATPSYTWITTGNLNEPLLLTNAAGAVTASTTRDPWGNPILLAGTEPLDLGYPGQWRDPATGLFQNWHRDYDPTLGRYAQADPLGLGGGSNVFAYVGGDPVNMVDPMGLEKVIFFSPFADNSFWKGAMSEVDMPGACLVYGHMAPSGIEVWVNGRREFLTNPDDINRELMKRGCKPRQPVYFLGCRSGLGENSIAERYTRRFRIRTAAPTTYTWWKGPGPKDRFWPYGYNGTYGKTPDEKKNLDDPGHWRVFEP